MALLLFVSQFVYVHKRGDLQLVQLLQQLRFHTDHPVNVNQKKICILKRRERAKKKRNAKCKIAHSVEQWLLLPFV